MLRTLSAVLLFTGVGLAPAADGPRLVDIVRSNGASVAGATVWVCTYTRNGEVESAEMTTDAGGPFTATVARRHRLTGWAMACS